MSTPETKKYSNRKQTPKSRPRKFPYLGEKIKEIMRELDLNQSEISRLTGIKQSSLSKCIGGTGSIVEAGVMSLSTRLPKHIPISWLTAGPDAPPLKVAIEQEQKGRSVSSLAQEEANFLEEVSRIREKYSELGVMLARFYSLLEKNKQS